MRPRWWWAAAPLLAASLWRGAGAEHGGSHAPHAAFSVSRARVLLEPGAVVSVNATVLVGASSWVTVSWSLPASVSPNASDLLALYLASASVTASAPLKFKPATGAHTGSTSFQILNQRAPVVFYYFLGGPSGALVNPTAVAVSPQLSFANPNEPTNIHLALTGTAGQMRVTWSTNNSVGAGVKWGLSNSALSNVVAATSSSYAVTDLCALDHRGRPSVATTTGWMPPGTIHTAVLSGLPPWTVVFYSVGSPSNGYSATYSFKTAPARGAAVRVAITADMGQADADGSNIVHGINLATQSLATSYFEMLPSLKNSALMAAEVGLRNASAVIHSGDISYAMGYGSLWDTYGFVTQQFASAAPLMVTHGNHESDWPGNPNSGLFNVTNTDSGGECGVSTAARYIMPPPALASAATPWYSFDVGAVHFTAFSTEHPYGPGTPQYAFIAADLAAAAAARDAASPILGSPGGAASTAPRWLVFLGHRPFYISSPYNTGVAGDGPAAEAMQAALEPLWAQYGVDVTFAGHHHSYQRTAAVSYQARTAPCDGAGGSVQSGTTHVVLGHGGAGFSTATCLPPAPSAAAAAASYCPMGPLFNVVTGGSTAGSNSNSQPLLPGTSHGYGVITADSGSFTFTGYAAGDVASVPAMTVMDRFMLKRPAGPRACFPPARSLAASGGAGAVSTTSSELIFPPPGSGATQPPPPPSNGQKNPASTTSSSEVHAPPPGVGPSSAPGSSAQPSTAPQQERPVGGVIAAVVILMLLSMAGIGLCIGLVLRRENRAPAHLSFAPITEKETRGEMLLATSRQANAMPPPPPPPPPPMQLTSAV